MPVRRRIDPSSALEWACGLAICALKLGLVYGRPLCPRPLPHDDLLFFQLARSIQDTGWLGRYHHLTLVKGAFLPVYLAASARLGLPFLPGQDVLYLGGGDAGARAGGAQSSRASSRPVRLAWGLGLGIVLGPQWLTREEACGSCRRCSSPSEPRPGGSRVD